MKHVLDKKYALAWLIYVLFGLVSWVFSAMLTVQILRGLKSVVGDWQSLPSLAVPLYLAVLFCNLARFPATVFFNAAVYRLAIARILGAKLSFFECLRNSFLIEVSLFASPAFLWALNVCVPNPPFLFHVPYGPELLGPFFIVVVPLACSYLCFVWTLNLYAKDRNSWSGYALTKLVGWILFMSSLWMFARLQTSPEWLAQMIPLRPHYGEHEIRSWDILSELVVAVTALFGYRASVSVLPVPKRTSPWLTCKRWLGGIANLLVVSILLLALDRIRPPHNTAIMENCAFFRIWSERDQVGLLWNIEVLMACFATSLMSYWFTSPSYRDVVSEPANEEA
jgi:hypothetical protein